MFIFKILLIILIALPVIALSIFFYSQMLEFIKARNAIENEAIRQTVEEEKEAKQGKKRKRKRKKQDAKNAKETQEAHESQENQEAQQ